MTKKLKILLTCISLSMTMIGYAQVINCNPDPNGEPWIAGGLPEPTQEIRGDLDSYPRVELTAESLATPLPSQVDNSQLRCFENKSSQTHQLEMQYWPDIVTEQPEGYITDDNGNVQIHTREALAWLISAVNGFNGMEPDDFYGRKVTLEANISMAGASWITIGDGSSYGPQDQKKSFSGTFDGNGYIIDSLTVNLPNDPFKYKSFFGILKGAHIENVVIRHMYLNNIHLMNGIFFRQAESLEKDRETIETRINNCYLDIDSIYSDNSLEDALFGYANWGIITNCMVRCHIYRSRLDHHDAVSLFVGDNYGTIKNCASISDTLVTLACYPGIANRNFGCLENCYSYIGGWYGIPLWPPAPRMGIAYQNYGKILNCYFNTFINNHNYHYWFDERAVVDDYGITENALPFEANQDSQLPMWVLNDSTSISFPSGQVFKTNILQEALNEWTYAQIGYGDSVTYTHWCDEYFTFLPNGLPSLCSIDITETAEDYTSESPITIYPNPANDVVTIEGTEIAEVLVFNHLGQQVKTCHSDTIQVSDMPQGLYLLRITGKDGDCHIMRLIKL